MDFAGRHPASCCELSQRNRRLSTCKVIENLASDLDCLDASAALATHPAHPIAQYETLQHPTFGNAADISIMAFRIVE